MSAASNLESKAGSAPPASAAGAPARFSSHFAASRPKSADAASSQHALEAKRLLDIFRNWEPTYESSKLENPAIRWLCSQLWDGSTTACWNDVKVGISFGFGHGIIPQAMQWVNLFLQTLSAEQIVSRAANLTAHHDKFVGENVPERTDLPVHDSQ